MSEAQVEVVRGLFVAFNRRDLEGQLELLSEDYEWHAAFTGGGLVEGSVYHGREGFKRCWRDQAETWAEIKLEVQELRDLGHRVLAPCLGRLAVAADPRWIRARTNAMASDGVILRVPRSAVSARTSPETTSEWLTARSSATIPPPLQPTTTAGTADNSLSNAAASSA